MANARPLVADDLSVGMLVTVLRGIPKELPAEFPTGGLLTAMFGQTRYDSLRGVPLRILAVDLPFVAVKHECADPNCSQRATLDMREVELIRVSEEFARAMSVHEKLFEDKPAPARKWWQFWRR